MRGMRAKQTQVMLHLLFAQRRNNDRVSMAKSPIAGTKVRNAFTAHDLRSVLFQMQNRRRARRTQLVAHGEHECVVYMRDAPTFLVSDAYRSPQCSQMNTPVAGPIVRSQPMRRIPAAMEQRHCASVLFARPRGTTHRLQYALRGAYPA